MGGYNPYDQIPLHPLLRDMKLECIPVSASVRQWELKKDPVDVLIERVDKLISLLEADNSVFITGKRAIEMFDKLQGRT